MTKIGKRSLQMAAMAGLAAVAALTLDVEGILIGAPLGPREASAVIGRPLTPLSYAGVARRTTRRAVVAGAVIGSTMRYTTYPPYPTCVQGFDAYGRMYYRCP